MKRGKYPRDAEHRKLQSMVHQGQVGFWTGKKRSEETRAKLSLFWKNFYALGGMNPNKDKKPSPELLARMSAISKERFKDRTNHPMFGKKHSVDARMKISSSAKLRFADPSQHPMWLGGKSFDGYPRDFTRYLKKLVRERDDFTCQLCGVREEDYFQRLSVNHIDYNKNNCAESNLNTLCRSCNSKVNIGRNYWTLYFQQYQTCSP